MATHEILIAAGYAVGSLAGGYLAEYLTRYWPYGFALATILIAIAIQAMIFTNHKKTLTRIPEA